MLHMEEDRSQLTARKPLTRSHVPVRLVLNNPVFAVKAASRESNESKLTDAESRPAKTPSSSQPPPSAIFIDDQSRTQSLLNMSTQGSGYEPEHGYEPRKTEN